MAEEWDVRGREFDWLAVDEVGALAVFQSAGAGFVPGASLAAIDRNDEVTDALLRGHSALDPVPAYARHGSFSYDWSPEGRAYERIGVPHGPRSDLLIALLSRSPQLPLFRGSFADAAIVQDPEAFVDHG